MTEEIIIDGIDVAGCEHHLSTGYCQLQMIFQGMVLKLPFGKHLECNLCDKDCYYKQLKRLEQERDELKADVKQLTQWLDETRRDADIIQNNCIELKQENERLKSALEKIREMVQRHLDAKEICYGYQVVEIINEVLNP